MGNSMIKTAVKEERWEEVERLLRERQYNSEDIDEFITSCKAVNKFYVSDDIMTHFSSDQQKQFITASVKKRQWQAAGRMLTFCEDSDTCAWVIEEATRDDDRDIVTYILPHCKNCNGDQLESVLKHLVRRRMWRSVGRVLERGVSDTLYGWTVQEAFKSSSDYDFERYILPQCRDDDKELIRAVWKEQWWSVGEVLAMRVRCALDSWAVEEASKRVTDLDFEQDILPHCRSDHLETVLKHLLTRGMWQSVGGVLDRGVSDTLHMWAVQEALKNSSYNDIECYILPHCNDDQLKSVLKQLVTRGMWRSVGRVLERGVSDTLYMWAVQEALESTSDDAFERCILPYCNDGQLEAVLKYLVTRRMWQSVGKVLGSVKDTPHMWAAEVAMNRADDWTFQRYILPHCSDDHLESVLKQLVTRRMWQSVGKGLEKGVSDTLYMWAVQEAFKSSSNQDFDRYILPYCTEYDKELIRAVCNEQWGSVGEVLAAGVRCALESWAVEEASKRATDLDFEQYILPHCNDDQVESVLKNLATRDMWWSVGKVLERGVSDTLFKWAVEQAFERSNDNDLERYILPHCSNDQLQSVFNQLVTRGMWQSVGKVIAKGVSDTLCKWSVEEAINRADDWSFQRYILPRCSDDHLEAVLTQLVARRMWQSVGKVIERGVSDTLYRWAVQEAWKSSNYKDFERYIMPHCNDDHLESLLKQLVTQGMWQSVGTVLERGASDTLCRCVVQETLASSSYTNIERYILPHCKDDQLGFVLKQLVTQGMWQSVGKVLERGVSDILYRWSAEEASKRLDDLSFKRYILPYCSDGQLNSAIPHLVKRGRLELLRTMTKQGDTQHMLVLSEMCRTMTYYTVMKQIEVLGQPSVQLLIRCLSSGQLTTEAKSVALPFALHQNKWDIIRKVSLSHVWEQVRRELFRAAVEQRRWGLVKKWADHTVYDNQRWWAQEEAYKEKQWNVMLLLTDYGMTDIELMRVRYRLAKYADWGFVVRMIERGVDVTEVREVVESAMVSRKTARDEAKRRALVVRWHQLRQLEDHFSKASTGRVRKWSLVLFYLHRHHRRHPSLQQLLQRAIKDEAWRVVRHLLRLGLDTAQRESLLTDMVSRGQWGVCRVLLEQGVSVQSCLEALPVLTDSDQWTLVARVMEYNVGDDCRRRVMRGAMEKREGSVVWQCIRTMQHYRLSVEERETLFQLAMSGGVWEVVKPLMEEVDSTGLRHRDTALLEAIEQHQCDVVDYCQWHKADINIKDDQGQTPLNRAGRKKDWKAVKELVIRGGDPNVSDINNRCMLNIVIHANKWLLTRLIIEYHGHIHVVDDFGSTPLQLLIDKRKGGGIIHHTLVWCPDQSKVVNEAGETTLHAIALDKRPELLYSQIVRGVNPLTLTKGGQSVLLYAVQNPHSAQRMVAECIKLGFGTHQPQFNGPMTVAQLYQHVVHRHWGNLHLLLCCGL